MPSQASYIFKYVFQLISLHSYFLFPTSVTHPYHFILLKYTSICEVRFVICCFFQYYTPWALFPPAYSFEHTAVKIV